MTTAPSFPPLLRGLPVAPGQSAFEKALAQASLGTDPGLVVYEESDDLDAALVLAPEASLEDAMAMLMVGGLGFSDALGALAPPEVAVHLSWPGGIFVNGAKCGGFSIDAATRDPKAEPDWLVLGVSVAMASVDGRPGDAPDQTSLAEEGCIEILPRDLIESWSRHTLVWIHRWLEDGFAPVAEAWRGKGMDVGEETGVTLGGTLHTGTFMGLDERGGMILRGDETRILPLSSLLEAI